MKKALLTIFCIYNLSLFAQQQTYDLIVYDPPSKSEWTKDEKNNVIVYSKVDNKNRTWCQLGVYKSTASKGSIEEDLKSEWNELCVKFYKLTGTMQTSKTYEGEGWKIKSATGKFSYDNQEPTVVLTTFSGFGRCVSIVGTTNNQAFLETIENFVDYVDLKKPNTSIVTNNNQTILQSNPVTQAANNGFAFNITNFDDGWTSTVKEDWVEVTKGGIKVLLHYPKEGTIFPADPEPLTIAAWNILVAPRYSNLKNFKSSYINTYIRPYLGMGYLTDNASGKQVFVLLFRQGSSGWLEFVAPDKNSFIQQYKFDPELIRWDSESELLTPLTRMTGYNKFAVGPGDFKGTWTSDFTGVQQLYYVYTGNYAGMQINQSNETFEFTNDGNYNWKLLAINGMVGSATYAQVKSSGKLSVLNNWQVSCSDIEGKPKRYHAFFSCIKGARLLNLLDADAPGSGNYTVFGKK
jgi:hypothetical protein